MANKPTWVFVAGTYRTASTTQYLLARDIVEETKSGIGIGYHTEAKLQEFDRMPPHGRYILCKVFMYLPDTSPHGARFLSEKRIKTLCTIRDPRDIITSMKARTEARRPNGKVAEKWDYKKTATVNFPKWLAQEQQWIDLGSSITLVTRFEEMVVNLYRETKRIAEHLEIDLPSDLGKDIASRYTIQSQRDRKREMRGKKEDPWLPSIPGIKFGTEGIWRTWLSTPEAKLVTEANAEIMKKWGYLE